MHLQVHVGKTHNRECGIKKASSRVARVFRPTASPHRVQPEVEVRPMMHHGSIFAAVALSALLLAPQPSLAAMDLPNKETDNNSPMVAELRRRSEEKREERAKERLNDYYRRNYKDYFEFISPGDLGRSENGKAISQWLKQNS